MTNLFEMKKVAALIPVALGEIEPCLKQKSDNPALKEIAKILIREGAIQEINDLDRFALNILAINLDDNIYELENDLR